MFTDKKIVVVLEYIVGFSLLIVVLPSIVHPHPGWSDAHGWAYLLFIACSGFILISCASSMRQRMKLNQRIVQLEQTLENLKPAQKQSHNVSGQNSPTRQELISSLN